MGPADMLRILIPVLSGVQYDSYNETIKTSITDDREDILKPSHSPNSAKLQKSYSFCHCVQTRSGIHPASYAKYTRLFLW
jgi:hypothetical protein